MGDPRFGVPLLVKPRWSDVKIFECPVPKTREETTPSSLSNSLLRLQCVDNSPSWSQV